MLKSLNYIRDIISKTSTKPKFIKPFQKNHINLNKLVSRNLYILTDQNPKQFNNKFSKNRYSSSNTGDPYDKQRLYILVGGTSFVLGTTFFYLFYKKRKSNIQDISKSKKGLSSKKKKPVEDLPKEIQYLIIGAGTAAHAACRSIRSSDTNAKVLIIGEEDYFPYMRPPLSKEFWHIDDEEMLKKLHFKQWNGKERSIFYEKNAFYTPLKELSKSEHGGVSVAMGTKAIKIDVVEQKVHLEDGQVISYQKCLIATGGTPKNIPVFAQADSKVQEKVTLFRTIEDFFYLDNLIKSGKEIVIVGGGFLGSELACSLGKRASETKSLKIKQLFPEKGNMGHVLPEYLSVWATEQVRKEGVEVIPECKVVSCSFNNKQNKVELQLSNGQNITADEIVVAVGLDVNTELAKESSLEVDSKFGGFLVNAELEARTNVWVAGDAACFYDTMLGRRRVEHHDHAVVSGRLAGENMATTGPRRPYWHQSMFWSDLGPYVGYDGIGLTDSSLQTVAVFSQSTDTPKATAQVETLDNPTDTPKQSTQETSLRNNAVVEEKNKDKASKQNTLEEVNNASSNMNSDDFSKGVIFYLKNDVVVGILLWNLFNRMPTARKVLNERKKFEDLNEVAKLFHLFGEAEDEDVLVDKEP